VAEPVVIHEVDRSIADHLVRDLSVTHGRVPRGGCSHFANRLRHCLMASATDVKRSGLAPSVRKWSIREYQYADAGLVRVHEL
jgi:hypothetical protein